MEVIIIEIASAVVSATAIIVVAIIETRNKCRQNIEESRRQRREKETRLSMELISASVDLAYVTSLAVTGGQTNGNVEEAQKKAVKAQEAYEDFLKAETAHAVSK